MHGKMTLWLASPYCTSNSIQFIVGFSWASVIRPTVASSNPHIPWNFLSPKHSKYSLWNNNTKFQITPNAIWELSICNLLWRQHLKFKEIFPTIILTILHLKWMNLHQREYFTWAIQPFISPLLRGAHASGQPEPDLDPTYFQLGSGSGKEPKFKFWTRLIFELGSTIHTCCL